MTLLSILIILKRMTKLELYLSALIITILAVGVGYFIFQNQKLTRQIQSSPEVHVSPSPRTQAQSPTTQTKNKLTSKQTEEQITSAVNSKNYQALAGYMTQPKVNFSLMSSECCEPMSPEEAVEQMDYIAQGIPFTFDQQNTTIKNLKTKNPQLANTFIGLSTTGEQTASFALNDANKISAVQLSVSYKLYSQ